MGTWKIGYLSGLYDYSTYESGREAHDKFGADVIDLDSETMRRATGKVYSTFGEYIACSDIINYPNASNTTLANAPISIGPNEFGHGFIRILSGACKNNVYHVVSDPPGYTDFLKLDTTVYSDGVRDNDYFEVVTGACTFEFPAGRNPNRQDFKRMIMNTSVRYPYYGGGLVIPQGWQPDDFMVMSQLTDARDADRLEIMLNHILDYKGFDGLYSIGKLNNNPLGFAPMVLETGSHYAQYQHLVNVVDYDITMDAKKSSDFYEVAIHFEGYNSPIYRGV